MTDLRSLAFDPELTPGARNAVRVCLRVEPGEKVTLITDRASAEIRRDVSPANWTTPAPSTRPLCSRTSLRGRWRTMPPAILADMESSAVSIYAVEAQANELRTRMQMTDVVNRRRIRHAHMVNIEKRIMLEGMRADFLEVDALSVRVFDIASKASVIRAHHAGWHRHSRSHEPVVQVAQDQRHHQSQQVGQPAGRRDLHRSRRGEWRVCDRWRGGRLSLRQVRRPARDAAHHPRGRQPPAGAVECQPGARRRVLEVHAHRREQRPGGRVRHRHQHRRARRDRQHPAGREDSRPCTSPSATRMARTPAPTGTRRRTSTWWGGSSTYGADDRQIMRAGVFLV